MRRFEAYEDENGNWRWRLWGGDEKIVATSGEAYRSQADALRAAETVGATAAGAEVSPDPGLGIKAALRLRALLAGGERADAPRLANDVKGPRRRRLRPAANPAPLGRGRLRSAH
jgi:uncharacterized protein YegP (UPF0339 family)